MTATTFVATLGALATASVAPATAIAVATASILTAFSLRVAGALIPRAAPVARGAGADGRTRAGAGDGAN